MSTCVPYCLPFYHLVIFSLPICILVLFWHLYLLAVVYQHICAVLCLSVLYIYAYLYLPVFCLPVLIPVLRYHVYTSTCIISILCLLVYIHLYYVFLYYVYLPVKHLYHKLFQCWYSNCVLGRERCKCEEELYETSSLYADQGPTCCYAKVNQKSDNIEELEESRN